MSSGLSQHLRMRYLGLSGDELDTLCLLRPAITKHEILIKSTGYPIFVVFCRASSLISKDGGLRFSLLFCVG